MLAATLSLLLFAAPQPDVAGEVSSLLKAKKLKQVDYRDCERSEQLPSRVEVFTDEHGVVRKLVNSFGGDDSSHTATHFYDAEGRVRVLELDIGAVPDTWVKARFWIDESGKIAKKRRTFGGERAGAYANDPGDYLITSPKQWLSRHGCPAS